MKPTFTSFKFAICLTVQLALHGVIWTSVQAQDSGHILNYRDAEIRAFIDDIASITGRTFIIDPRVRGKINVVSSEEVTVEGVSNVPVCSEGEWFYFGANRERCL